MALKPLTAEEIADIREGIVKHGDFGAGDGAAIISLLDEVERSRVQLDDCANGHRSLTEQRADLEMQRTAIGDLQAACDNYEKRTKDAEAVAERSRALLKRIEWDRRGLPEGLGAYCPCCGAWSGLPEPQFPEDAGTGHKPGCELAALIG